MAQGFVYVLINPSFPDQVKIGLTEQTSELRAKQLRTTGVPTPFIVVYDELVSECELVESKLHQRFAAYRVSSDREFFRIPVRDAVRALQEEAAIYKISDSVLSNQVEVLPQLKHYYSKYLKLDIASVAIVQLVDVCFLEITRRNYYPGLRDEIIERVDLAIVAAEMFSPQNSIDENTRRFLDDLDAYDLIMITSLFTEEGCKQISHEWERGNKLKHSSFFID
ncbi:GIY-YIG nuclease family protein [Nostoc sp. WHI]|uniref:GIY-YIG nuclease family protein n=1 Tax=Nostoc sp. WHI TaxID=2650611 RepID=UPI0018C593AA|nr:GIY-YIG nuclease family protein [Nostoc sp. WHI]MBG1267185.1 GIY-YIG nuclease family protein [Nostoc sp. WHI]